MSNRGAAWMIDPTAGVRLMPAVAECPRCGVEKGRASECRPGLCRDCYRVLTVDERPVWMRAA